MVIAQGEVYWISFDGRGSAPSERRPAIVVQHDRYNRSAISTTVVAAVTSNLRLAEMPGNVRLRRGDGGLTRASVVNVTQLATVDKARLAKRIGKLGGARVRDVLAGLALVFGYENPDRP